MKGVSESAVLTITFAALAQPLLAGTYLNCSTRKVVITSGPSGDTSSTKEEDLAFWVDDAAKTFTFRDDTPLNIKRIDRSWITADRDGIFYEFKSPRWHLELRSRDNERRSYDHHCGVRSV